MFDQTMSVLAREAFCKTDTSEWYIQNRVIRLLALKLRCIGSKQLLLFTTQEELDRAALFGSFLLAPGRFFIANLSVSPVFAHSPDNVFDILPYPSSILQTLKV